MPVPSSTGGLAAVRALLAAFKKEPKVEEKFGPAFEGDMGEMGNAAMGMREGQADPRLEGASKEELAQMDRFGQFEASGEQTGLLGLPSAALTAGGYEAFGKSPLLGSLMAKLSGDEQFEVDERTSKPSMANVKAALRGFMSGARRRK